MIRTISFNERVKISYHCGSSLLYNGKLDQITFEKKKAKQLAETNQNNSCMLQIYNTDTKLSEKQIDVTYSCDSKVKSLKEILEQGLNDEQKMEYFCKLIELAINHYKQRITHFNIKPSNVILYKDKFYLIDFGYLDNKPSELIINLNQNFYKDNDNENKRNLFPYLNEEYLSQIKENKIEIQKEKEKQKFQVKIQNYDRYALGVMMLELFVPFDKIYKNFDIDTCVEEAKHRGKQLEKISLCQKIYGNDVLTKINQIIYDILLNNQKLPSDDVVIELKQHSQKQQKISLQLNQNLSMSYVNESDSDNLIDKTSEITLLEKMKADNKTYVINLTEKGTLQFDPNLLYYLDQAELEDYSSKILGLHLEELKAKAQKILSFFHIHYEQQGYQEDFSELSKEDKYYILNNILTDYKKFEYNIQEQIEKLNLIELNEFKFNQINKGLTQEKEIKQEIELPQKKEQTQKLFGQMLQNKIPNIMRFLEYQSLLKQQENNQELNYEFEQKEGQNANFYSATKLKNPNEFWTIFEKPEKQYTQKKLYIGKSRADTDQQFEGRVIEETKYKILDYENVKYNFEKDENFGTNVKVSIYNKSMFELISFYKGELNGNKYDGEGFIKDWKNNYEYKGQWKQGKKDGKGKLKILNTEVLQENEYSELDQVQYSDDYLKFGITPKSMEQGKKSFEITFYFYEAMSIYKLKDKCDHKCDDKCQEKCYHQCDDKCGGKRNPKYLIKFDCSKLCKNVESKLADSLHSIKNSLCKCKKPGEKEKTNSN